MTTIWRAAWREQQDAAPPIEREAWFDDEQQAWDRKAEVERGGGIVGQVVVYRVTVETERERVA